MEKCKRCHVDLDHEEDTICDHCSADLINEFRRNIQTTVSSLKRFNRSLGQYHAEIIANEFGWDVVEDETSGESSIIIYTGLKAEYPVKV